MNRTSELLSKPEIVNDLFAATEQGFLTLDAYAGKVISETGEAADFRTMPQQSLVYYPDQLEQVTKNKLDWFMLKDQVDMSWGIELGRRKNKPSVLFVQALLEYGLVKVDDWLLSRLVQPIPFRGGILPKVILSFPFMSQDQFYKTFATRPALGGGVTVATIGEIHPLRNKIVQEYGLQGCKVLKVTGSPKTLGTHSPFRFVNEFKSTPDQKSIFKK